MIVVNFSTGHYLRGQQRLKDSLQGVEFMGLTSYGEVRTPSHENSPYHFKIGAIKRALEKDPIVLWADSSLYRVGDLSKIQTIIETDGYFMEEAGHYVKDWCDEPTLNYFGIDRSTPFTMFSAGLLGLNFNTDIAKQFFERWEKSAVDGHFRGSWKTHRHDMTCGSIIASQLGMKYQTGGTHLAYIGQGYSKPKDGVVFYCQGM